MTCLNQETSQDSWNYLEAVENKSIFYTKEFTLNLWHGSKQDRLDKQIATALISFNSFLKLEHDPVAAIMASYKKVYNRFKYLNESTFFIINWLTAYLKSLFKRLMLGSC